MDLLFDDNDELFAVRGLEGFRGLDLLCVADVVFRVEEGVDCVRTHGVCVRYEGFVVGGEEGRWWVFTIHDCS